MDVSAIVLNKILAAKDLETWAKLKAAYLGPEYASLYMLNTLVHARL